MNSKKEKRKRNKGGEKHNKTKQNKTNNNKKCTTKSQQKKENSNNKNNKNNFNCWIDYQHTYIPLQNNIHVPKVHCGSAVRFGRTLLGFLITTLHLHAFLLYLEGYY